MTEPTPALSGHDSPGTNADVPPRIPGERRLAHPPSDRYRVADPAPSTEDQSATVARGVVHGLLAAIIGAAVITFLGGVLAVSSGLIVVAAATGWTVGVAVRIGAGGRLLPGRRIRTAIGLALLAVALGQLGLWTYARNEGGVLGPLDYVVEVFGVLVPIEFVAAWIVAWVAAR